ncbi:MAG: hypothetical protein MUP17_00095 [candidate division Zixibacteria bacterium]|nr:hypothetical protein [candidate division Zixibacteria bacterium]
MLSSSSKNDEDDNILVEQFVGEGLAPSRFSGAHEGFPYVFWGIRAYCNTPLQTHKSKINSKSGSLQQPDLPKIKVAKIIAGALLDNFRG